MKKIGIDGEMFSDLRTNFDAVLYRTLLNMREKKCDSASISIRISIELDKVSDVYKSRDGIVKRDLADKPIFFHKISSTMKIKDEEDGCFDENYKMELNGAGEFVLVPISDGQMQLYFEDENDEEN